MIATHSVAAGAVDSGGTVDPPACSTVRFSDVGWTDVTATTALTAQLLRDIGYTPAITVLSVPVTFASLQNNDIDVFLGNWMPAQEADRSRYLADGSIVVVRPNLEGAKYTLAVPAYTYAQGLKDFGDIHRFAPALNHSIYGIEPGNDGNRHVLEMLKQDQFGLGDFKLIESSEQGMLAQVERAYRNQAAHRVPGVGTASDEHALRYQISERRRCGVRPKFWRCNDLHGDAQGIRRRVSEHRPLAGESQIHPARRE